MPLTRRARAWVVMALTVSILGCAAPGRLYVNSEADMAYYRKVAVLPFQNLSSERFASDRVVRTLVTEFVIAERFQIVDPGELRAILERTGGVSVDGSIDPKKLRDAATQLEVTGYIRGAVTEYGTQGRSSSDVPVIAFDVEMVDVATGNVVWRASITKRGKGRFPAFGGASTMSRLTLDACRDIVQRIERGAY